MRLDEKLHHIAFSRNRHESDFEVFMREDGNPSLAFIDSLSLDIKHNEYDFSKTEQPKHRVVDKTSEAPPEHSDSVFIVHGHDETLKVKAARFVEKMGFRAVILHEQANRGQTVIEKIEANTNIGFAIVLSTEDDLGDSKQEAEAGRLNRRARQNVLFEHGYLMSKLGRSRVAPLVSGKPELPSDISGIVSVDGSNWQVDIAKEMKAAGYAVDFNKLIDS